MYEGRASGSDSLTTPVSAPASLMLVLFGGHHWRPAQTCKLQLLPPPVLTSCDETDTFGASSGTHPTGIIFCYCLQTNFAKAMFSQVFVCPRMGGGLCPGGLCPGRGSLSWQGGSVQRVLCLGGSLPWQGFLSRQGSLSRGVCVTKIPPYGKERVVGILLECILVYTELSLCLHTTWRTVPGSKRRRFCFRTLTSTVL